MNYNFFKYEDNFNLNREIESNLVFGIKQRKTVKFTIAIPTYQRPCLLEVALKSAINQITSVEYEIIVIDNDSANSEVLDIIKEYSTFSNLYYFQNDKNIGMFGNWNRCIELAKGEYITILNDDDWLSFDYLEKCLINLKASVDGLYFKNNIVYEQKFSSNANKEKNVLLKRILNILSKKSKKLSLFDFYLGNKSAGTLGVLLKTEYLKELGGYNPEYFPSSDYVLHANYCYNYNVHLINEKLNYYRIAENESAKQETLQKWEYLDNAIRKYFIPLIGKNKKVLLIMNSIIQENRVKGLVDNWNYKTETKVNHKLRHKVFHKLVGLKYYLNI